MKKKGKKGKKKVFDKTAGMYESHEPLVKGDPMLKTSAAPVDKGNWNRADMTLKRMTQNSGIPRQKVRVK